MRQLWVRISLCCVALTCLCLLVLQPLRLVSEDNTRLTIRFGKTVPIIAIAELAGGYRCYVSDEEYFWLSSADCTQTTGEPLRVVFSLRDPAIIYRSET